MSTLTLAKACYLSVLKQVSLSLCESSAMLHFYYFTLPQPTKLGIEKNYFTVSTAVRNLLTNWLPFTSLIFLFRMRIYINCENEIN